MPQHIISRVGEKNMMNCGLEAEIIEYFNTSDITVRFSNGQIAKNHTYQQFRFGRILCPGVKILHSSQNKGSTRIGQKYMQNCGVEAECIAYRNVADIDIRFSTGEILEHTLWNNFKKGLIRPPKDVRDHLGNNFSSVNEMCKHHNVNPHTYQDRIARGYSMEDALFSGRYPTVRLETYFVYEGKKYPNLRLFAEEYDISYDRLIKLRAKYEAEEAADIVIQERESGYVNPAENKSAVRVGITIRQRCGLDATCIEYNNAHGASLRFEDGEVVTRKEYRSFINGKIGHPHLLIRPWKTEFHVFAAKYTAIDGKKVYYDCECQKCRLKDVLTPQQMIEHSKSHEESND